MSGTSIIAQFSMPLKTNGSLMKVESIAEWLGAFCNAFDVH